MGSCHWTAAGTPWAMLLASLAFVAHHPPAQAQEQVLEEIVVTGSLLKRESVYDGRAPIQTIDTTLIETTGAVQPIDLLKTLTINTGSEYSGEQTNQQGVSQFSLRGLGVSSTLTLINGRRAGVSPVGDNTANTFLDINTLPVTMIERIEVLRDGASATYGSEAVAGVVNIITRKGFEGFELSGGYRDAANDSYDFGVAMGGGGDQGHFNLYASYFRNDDILLRRDFDFIVDRAIDPNGDGDPLDGSYTSGIGSPGTYRRATVNPDGSAVGYPGAAFAPDADCAAAGGIPTSSLCRLDFSNSRSVLASEERYQVFAEADYAVSDRVTAFAELSYSSNQINDLVGAQTFSNPNVADGGVLIPANHPFNFWTDPDNDGVLTYVDPANWDPATDEAVDLSMIGRPIGIEANSLDGGTKSTVEFNNFRVMMGIDVDFSDRWYGTGYISQANSRMSSVSANMWHGPNWWATIIDGRWNPFGTRKSDPDLVTPKTVNGDGLDPGNVGATAANDQTTLDLFRTMDNETAKTEQTVIEFVLSGTALQLDGFDIPLALGAQYRSLDYEENPLAVFGSGSGVFPNRLFPRSSQQEVWAVFGEIILPISDMGELQIAVRHEDYEQAGSTTDPKISAQINANEWLAFRGSWGTSFQAPSVLQTAGSSSTATIDDAFDSAGNCSISNGAINRPGVNNQVVSIVNGGELEPQSADSYNFGILFSPTDSVRASLDYWRFDYEDVISQNQSFQAIVDDDCFDDGIPNDPRVVRNPSGQITSVEANYVNVGAVVTEGFDLNAAWDLHTEFGTFELNAVATLITKFDVDATGDGYVDQLGSRNSRNGFAANPELRYNAGVTWVRGNHIANVTARYIDSYENDQTSPTNPPSIDDWLTFDAYYAYTFVDVVSSGSDMTLSVGVNNLTDEDPPGLPTFASGSQRYNQRPGYDGTVHDLRGRQTYLRFNYTF